MSARGDGQICVLCGGPARGLASIYKDLHLITRIAKEYSPRMWLAGLEKYVPHLRTRLARWTTRPLHEQLSAIASDCGHDLAGKCVLS